MKILHITCSDSGGAGWCVLRLHKSLLKLGVDSKMLVSNKSSDLATVFCAEESGLNTYIPPQNQLLRRYEKIMRRRGCYLTPLEKYQRSASCVMDKTLFTFPLSRFDLSNHPLVAEADVIHLHWVANFLDYPTFFQRVEKPIVWTFHDENIGFGGFHYQMEKDKYYELCKDIEDKLWTIKAEALSLTKCSIHPVALSEMMKEFLGNVPVMNEFPPVVIHNSVDGDSFVPFSKSVARKIFGIPENNLVFGFCSVDLSDRRKGLRELLLALEQLDDLSRITLICAGEGIVPSQTSCQIVKTGALHNERIMSLFYSSADFFMMPSYQEAFAQTPIEAMACGVPVVAFPCSGTKDLINENNGIVCEDFSVESLLKGIKRALNVRYDARLIRQDVINRFAPDVIARQYIDLYQHAQK